MTAQDKYCTECGEVLVKRKCSPRKFDGKTGKRLEEIVCINSKCVIGCGNTGGHEFTKSLFKVGKCKYCGFDQSDIDCVW